MLQSTLSKISEKGKKVASMLFQKFWEGYFIFPDSIIVCKKGFANEKRDKINDKLSTVMPMIRAFLLNNTVSMSGGFSYRRNDGAVRFIIIKRLLS